MSYYFARVLALVSLIILKILFQLFFIFLETQEGVCITLEGAQATFLSHDRVVLSLKNGELYVLTIHADSMRSVRNFHFEKAAASVLTTCVSCIISYLPS